MFGHVPLLAQPAVADFMQAMGEEGLAAMETGALHRLARLYWYSVEFGLAREDGETRIYGAGLLSSFGESRFALESPKPRRRAFDLEQVLRTRYRSDAFQQGYFVIAELRCAAPAAEGRGSGRRSIDELGRKSARSGPDFQGRRSSDVHVHVDLAHRRFWRACRRGGAGSRALRARSMSRMTRSPSRVVSSDEETLMRPMPAIW